MKSALERFMGKVTLVPFTDCWIWNGASKKTGYGNFFLNGRTVGAHVAAYELHKGAILEGTVICHRCDNPACVNPDHLFAGTHRENMQDMDRKGRRITSPKNGELNPMFGKRHSDDARMKIASSKSGRYTKSRHPRASINEETAETIKRLKGRMTAKEVSQLVGASFHVVRNIWRGKSW